MTKTQRFLSSVVGALLALGVVSAGYAYAQTDGTTDTTEAPAQQAPPAPDEKDCPLKGQRPGQASSGSSITPAPAPSAEEA